MKSPPQDDWLGIARWERGKTRPTFPDTLMRLIKNSGNDRVVDDLRKTLAPGSELDIASPLFSLFAYLPAATLRSLDARYETLLARIVTMASQPEKWVLPSGGRRGEGGKR